MSSAAIVGVASQRSNLALSTNGGVSSIEARNRRRGQSVRGRNGEGGSPPIMDRNGIGVLFR